MNVSSIVRPLSYFLSLYTFLPSHLIRVFISLFILKNKPGCNLNLLRWQNHSVILVSGDPFLYIEARRVVSHDISTLHRHSMQAHCVRPGGGGSTCYCSGGPGRQFVATQMWRRCRLGLTSANCEHVAKENTFNTQAWKGVPLCLSHCSRWLYLHSFSRAFITFLGGERGGIFLGGIFLVLTVRLRLRRNVICDKWEYSHRITRDRTRRVWVPAFRSSQSIWKAQNTL